MIGLREHYTKTVRPELQKEFGYGNALAVPRIEKVVINVGLSKALQDKKWIDIAEKTLKRISGQKPVLTKAKKSISNFKIREGMVVGAVVTLRGARMYDFLQKFIHVTLPRMRDFHGLESKKGFDGRGGYSVGLREHIIFPEVGAEELEHMHGLEITIKTTAPDQKQTFALLKKFGFPFKV